MSTEATKARFASLAAVVEATPPRERWLLLTHDNPDPDALASTAALAAILRRFKRRSTIAYGGMIGRAENREMVRALKLDLSHLRHLNRRNYQHFALIDCQPWTGNSQLPDGVVPDVVFDHHPLRKRTLAVPFFDVRPAYGATATILAEYLEAAGIQPTKALATGLVYAIRSETQDFGREAAGPDHAAFDRLLGVIDRRTLSKIQNARLPISYFHNLRRAIDGMSGVGNLVVTHVGRVEQPDIVPEIADMALRMEGKTWSLATGSHGDRLYLSIRTTNSRADAGNLMRKLIGRLGKGGGHGTMAGGWVTIPKTASDGGRALEREMAQSFARALKKRPERLQPIEAAAVEEPSRPAAVPG